MKKEFNTNKSYKELDLNVGDRFEINEDVELYEISDMEDFFNIEDSEKLSHKELQSLVKEHGLKLSDDDMVVIPKDTVVTLKEEKKWPVIEIDGAGKKKDLILDFPLKLEVEMKEKETIEVKDAKEQYIYLFPASGWTFDDTRSLKSYNLKELGRNRDINMGGNETGFINVVVQGSLEDLKEFGQDYLGGYELHPDYLYKAKDFAGELIPEEEADWYEGNGVTIQELAESIGCYPAQIKPGYENVEMFTEKDAEHYEGNYGEPAPENYPYGWVDKATWENFRKNDDDPYWLTFEEAVEELRGSEGMLRLKEESTHDSEVKEFNEKDIEKEIREILSKYNKEKTSKIDLFETKPGTFVEHYDDAGDIDFSTLEFHDDEKPMFTFSITGGLNGSGEWTDYLEDIKKAFEELEEKTKMEVVIQEIINDTADDVWTAKVFLCMRSNPEVKDESTKYPQEYCVRISYYNFGLRELPRRYFSTEEDADKYCIETMKKIYDKGFHINSGIITHKDGNNIVKVYIDDGSEKHWKLRDSLVKDVYPMKGESKEEFIARFMSATKEEYPDQKQRFAVANSYWERKDKKKMKDEEKVIEFDPYKDKIEKDKVVIVEEDIPYGDFLEFADAYEQFDNLSEKEIKGKLLDLGFKIDNWDQVIVPKGTQMKSLGSEANGWPTFEVFGLDIDFAGDPFSIRVSDEVKDGKEDPHAEKIIKAANESRKEAGQPKLTPGEEGEIAAMFEGKDKAPKKYRLFQVTNDRGDPIDGDEDEWILSEDESDAIEQIEYRGSYPDEVYASEIDEALSDKEIKQVIDDMFLGGDIDEEERIGLYETYILGEPEKLERKKPESYVVWKIGEEYFVRNNKAQRRMGFSKKDPEKFIISQEPFSMDITGFKTKEEAEAMVEKLKKEGVKDEFDEEAPYREKAQQLLESSGAKAVIYGYIMPEGKFLALPEMKACKTDEELKANTELIKEKFNGVTTVRVVYKKTSFGDEKNGEQQVDELEKDEVWVYHFRSPCKVTYSNEYQFSQVDYYPGSDFASEINEALGDTRNNGEDDLAKYIGKRDGLDSITSISLEAVEAGDEVECITTVESTKKLSEDEIEKLIDYITGQFSDGYGEGFEQHPVSKIYVDEGFEDYNEETGENEYYEEEVKSDVYCSLWYSPSKGWSLELFDEERI